MRGHFIAKLDDLSHYRLSGDSLHHLVNVIRLKPGQELLLLNGNGLQVKTRVESISKALIHLKKINAFKLDRNYELDLILGIPKRDALELCIRQAVEIGFRKIHLVRASYSQHDVPDFTRLKKICVSAIEQSNAPFLPTLINSYWDEINWSEYREVVIMDSEVATDQKKEIKICNPKALVVGPEGGFSKDEKLLFKNIMNVNMINLPTPLLRTPTAVAVGAGYIIESLLK